MKIRVLVAFTIEIKRKTPSSSIHVLRYSTKDIMKPNSKIVHLTNPRFGRKYSRINQIFIYRGKNVIFTYYLQHLIRPSKHYYIIGTDLMQGSNYGPIMIGMDKTKTLGDVKRKIVQFLKQNHDVSISEKSFELYKMNTKPINPGSFSRNISTPNFKL